MTKGVEITDELKKTIGQLFVFGFHGATLSQDILTLTAAPYYLGNVIFMKRNVAGSGEGYPGGRPEEISVMMASLQAHAREAGQERGLGIGTDQEGGLVSAFSTANVVTQFPGAMALASISDSTLSTSLQVTENVYAAQAKELSLLGVNCTYAPIGDVNSDRRNPVIGVRSFGDNPARVADYVSAACKGLVFHGVAPSIKHFPGHGDTHVDSHLGLPRIRRTLEQLEDTELVPWRHALNDPTLGDGLNLVTVMTGHMSLPSLTGNEDEPASLSRSVTHGLLREKLGFNGVVVTDCLEMDAIAKTKGIGSNPPSEDTEDEEWLGGPGIEEGAVMALEAGADIVMICHTFGEQVAAMEHVWDAVASGRLSLDSVKESGERIRKWKQALGLDWNTERMSRKWDQTKWLQVKDESAKISAAAYARVVVSLRAGPALSKSQPTVVYTPAMESYNKAVDDAEGVLRTQGGAIRNTAGASFLAFVESLTQYAPCSHVVYGKSQEIQPDTTQVVFVLRNADRGGWQLDALREVLKVAQTVVVVSSSTPYDLIDFTVEGGSDFTHLACGEYTAQALDAVASVVFGVRSAVGRLAVSA